ncbi:TolC family protein [candidate division KSB1 bacterium]
MNSLTQLKNMLRFSLILILLSVLLFSDTIAQEPRLLTFEDLAGITIQNSFTIKNVELNLMRRYFGYNAALAGLKSRVDLQLTAPEFNQQATEQYNSETQLSDFYDTKTEKYEAELSITQPFRTNGRLSANMNMDRFRQSDSDTDYTTRMFFRLDQPVFTSNELKRNIYETQLRLESAKIEYVRSRVFLIYGSGIVRGDFGGGRSRNTLSHYFYSLYEANRLQELNTANAEIINGLRDIAVQKYNAQEISEREFLQFEVELNNSQDRVYSSDTDKDKAKRALIQFTGLDPEEDFIIPDYLEYTPINIDEEFAVREGLRNNTGIRDIKIEIEEDSLEIEDVKSQREFRGNLSGTLGLDKTAQNFSNQFNEFDQSQSFDLTFFAPVWDWGRNGFRVESAEIQLEVKKRDLENDISDTERQVLANLYTINNMKKRIEIVSQARKISEKVLRIATDEFREGKISAEDVLLTVNKNYEAEVEYLKLIVDYKNSLVRLANQTQYDFEKGIRIRDEIEKMIDTIIEENRQRN